MSSTTPIPEQHGADQPVRGASVSAEPSNRLRTTLILIGSILTVILLVFVGLSVFARITVNDASAKRTIQETVTSLKVDVDFADVTVEFGKADKPKVVFNQNGVARNINFDTHVDDGNLVVDVHSTGGIVMPSFFDFGRSPRLTITLPDGLRGDSPDLDLTSSAGDIEVDGDFGVVTVTSSAGDIQFSGAAEEIGIESSAGDITADELAVSGDIEVNSTAGDIDFSLTELPTSLTISSIAGDQNLTLPDGEYRIDATTAAGDVRIDASNDKDASREVRLTATAGDITVVSR